MFEPKLITELPPGVFDFYLAEAKAGSLMFGPAVFSVEGRRLGQLICKIKPEYEVRYTKYLFKADPDASETDETDGQG